MLKINGIMYSFHDSVLLSLSNRDGYFECAAEYVGRGEHENGVLKMKLFSESKKLDAIRAQISKGFDGSVICFDDFEGRLKLVVNWEKYCPMESFIEEYMIEYKSIEAISYKCTEWYSD